MGRNWIFLVIAGFAIAGALYFSVYVFFGRSRPGSGHRKLSPSRPRKRFSLWPWGKRRREGYELVENPHEV
jgi:hypothetical protein